MKSQNRVNNPEKINRLIIEKSLKNGEAVIVQFSDKIYSDRILADLNELCLEYDDNFSIRFYGHYNDSFDCNILLRLPNIKNLWLDSLSQAYNLEALTELKKLECLSLGIYGLKETEILHINNFTNLKKLTIGPTQTKSLNLKYLENYGLLEELTICGHKKNIEEVGKLLNLKHLGLNSMSKDVRLNFINKLNNIKSLHFILGGRENLDEIEENNIEELEIMRVKSFANFRNITNFKNLKKLKIEDQMQLSEIHFEKEFPTLKNLKLLNCKTFNSLTGLEKLRGLDQLIISRTNIIFEEFIKQPFPKSLDSFMFYSGKTGLDQEIKKELLKLGYKTI